MATGEFNELIVKGADEVRGFLQKVVNPSLDELGLLLQDNVKRWRFSNQVRNLKKVKTIVEKNNLKLKQVNLKVLLPYLDGVSYEDNDELQDMWANLFTNYIDSSKTLTLTVYPSILKQLSSTEVKILKFMELNSDKFHRLKDKEFGFVDNELANLVRLGIIDHSLDLRTTHDERVEEWESQQYHLTEFGFYFLKACKRE